MLEIQSLKAYKYRTREDYTIKTPIVGYMVLKRYFRLRSNGELWIKAGYAWNGTSGGVPDTRRNLGASLIHDCLYQMLRERFIPLRLRGAIDELFGEHCKSLGTWRSTARVYVAMLRAFGKRSATRDQSPGAPTRSIPLP